MPLPENISAVIFDMDGTLMLIGAGGLGQDLRRGAGTFL